MKTLYHGTSSVNLDCIKTIGLVPGRAKGGDSWAKHHRMELAALAKSREPSVFLADEPEKAEDFARYAVEEMGGEPIIVTVAVPEAVFQTYKVDELYHQDKRKAHAWRCPSVDASYVADVLPVAPEPPQKIAFRNLIESLFA
ncbi:hypothetical protein [Tardiphaga sp. 367_B4_N1_1]|uniref:hypothetical protein n=1 Tax=Tardiphaga sp. 367_B4_N1_1 TaxID=3240777 RepID=UPI003F23C552